MDLSRNSSGVSPFSLTCLLLVFQWTMYASSSSLNVSKSGNSLPLKNSKLLCMSTHYS